MCHDYFLPNERKGPATVVSSRSAANFFRKWNRSREYFTPKALRAREAAQADGSLTPTNICKCIGDGNQGCPLVPRLQGSSVSWHKMRSPFKLFRFRYVAQGCKDPDVREDLDTCAETDQTKCCGSMWFYEIMHTSAMTPTCAVLLSKRKSGC